MIVPKNYGDCTRKCGHVFVVVHKMFDRNADNSHPFLVRTTDVRLLENKFKIDQFMQNYACAQAGFDIIVQSFDSK